MHFPLRFVATLLLLAGVAALVAVAGAWAVLPESSSARPLVLIVLQMAVVLVAGAAAAFYALATGRIPDAAAPPAVRVILTLVVIAAPAVMVWQLRPFLAEWRQVIELGAALRIWEDASSNMAGIVLVPIAAAVTPPFIELSTMGGFVMASVMLVILALVRSATLFRAYLTCMVLLAALVIVSSRGAAAAATAAEVAERAVRGSSRGGREADQIRGFVSRYTTAVNDAETVLWWTLGVYALMLPLFVLSGARNALDSQGRPRP